jgi:glutamate synthase domain-containing protein 2
MKTEVLRAIKKAEEEYQKEITEAKAEKERRLAAAALEADSLVMKARTGTRRGVSRMPGRRQTGDAGRSRGGAKTRRPSSGSRAGRTSTGR